MRLYSLKTTSRCQQYHYANGFFRIIGAAAVHLIRLHHGDESLKRWSDIVKRLSAMPDMKEVTWEESDVPR
jgi:hypothetical protein